MLPKIVATVGGEGVASGGVGIRTHTAGFFGQKEAKAIEKLSSIYGVGQSG
jgi:hypothetical protein